MSWLSAEGAERLRAGMPGRQVLPSRPGGQITIEPPCRLRAFWLCFRPLRAFWVRLFRLPEGHTILRVPHGEACRGIANIRHDSEA